MSESVSGPFTSYNQDRPPLTLTGNFFEESALLAATGVTRRRPIRSAAGAAAAVGTAAPAGVYPAPEDRAANSAQPSTFQRVIEHTEQQVGLRSTPTLVWAMQCPAS
jgi:hypothetical protein